MDLPVIYKMVKLIKISKNELPEIIRISYEGDKDLLDKYHINKYTLEGAVKKELELIEKMSTQLQLTYLKVLNADKVIGYVVKSGNFLYSFAISIYYRTSRILKEWWEALCLEMGDKFKVGLMSNNTRAIEYLKKRGLYITWQENDGEAIKEILLTS